MASRNQNKQQEIIRRIPAGGPTPMSPLSSNKELYTIGFRLAGIHKAYFVLRSGKWDISANFGDGTLLDMKLGYSNYGLAFRVPYTLSNSTMALETIR